MKTVLSIIVCAILTVTAGTAFAGLRGHGWYSADGYLTAQGRTRTTSNPTFCSRFSGTLECTLPEEGTPDYFLLECSRDRSICDGVLAIILPKGEPWMTMLEYRISSWTHERITATLVSDHACVVSTLQIDLDGQEVLLTETWTKAVDDHPFCAPENVGRTTTYKLEDY